MSNEKVIFTSPGGWLEVIETSNKFYYSRRKGRDSVAVFLTDPKLEKVLVRYQPLPRDNSDNQVLFPCPVTGSIIDEIPMDCAIREVEEETGYKNVVLHQIMDYLVGTQSDELVYVFHGTVDSTIDVQGQQDGTYFESISKNIWEPIESLRFTSYVASKLFYYWYKSF